MSAKGTHSRLPNNDEEEDGQTEISEDLESNSTVSQFEIEKIRVGERHLGTSLAFYFKNGEPLMTIGPHWPFFVCMWTCLVGVGVLVINYVSAKYGFWVNLLTYLLVFWEAFIYLATALKNPGIISKKFENTPEAIQQSKVKGYCKLCHVIQDGDDVVHCEDCDVCVTGYDHHCPWTGKCIARGNICPFYFFIFSTMIYLVYCILICVYTVE